MKVTGSATLAAPLPRVWDALQDPAVLASSIPGCHSLEAVGAGAYKMTITAGVASVRGTYVGQVALAEPEPPHSFVLRARGQGAPGTVEATVNVRLSEGADGTRVDYDADAVVGGMIGGVGQRMLGSVARRTAGEFFAAVERVLTAPVPAFAEAAPAEAASRQAPPAPAAVPPTLAQAAPVQAAPAQAVPVQAASPQATPVQAASAQAAPAQAPVPGAMFYGRAAEPAAGPERIAGPMTIAFGAGGLVALAGVVVGYALGRRRGGA
ncbi:hypothetical protein SAMN04489712_101217 [Thermomonospora echinospora]|uniref:Carbon monoxide dehydrogenase subunit G n=1 Tax=Thermomonospora echinospora TaxID=1992 RepID=A0A1H5SJP9_9ACTN|nr:carbon monoxide dehydrogenase subunit G [Thermomonospora echinospora]SEF50178.1 hypothetical protein SAMN04489712_101217 [Thermomonospora echinospora]